MTSQPNTLPSTAKSTIKNALSSSFKSFCHREAPACGYALDVKIEASTRLGKRRPRLSSWGHDEQISRTPSHPLLRFRPNLEGEQIRGKPATFEVPFLLLCLEVATSSANPAVALECQDVKVSWTTSVPNPFPPPIPPHAPLRDFFLPSRHHPVHQGHRGLSGRKTERSALCQICRPGRDGEWRKGRRDPMAC